MAKQRAVPALMHCTWSVICLGLSRSPWKTTRAHCDGRVDPSTEASASLQRRLHENVRHKRYGSIPSHFGTSERLQLLGGS
jgi:hypothetical protein